MNGTVPLCPLSPQRDDGQIRKLQIVTALVEQLDGALEIDTSAGTAFHIKFKELRYTERK